MQLTEHLDSALMKQAVKISDVISYMVVYLWMKQFFHLGKCYKIKNHLISNNATLLWHWLLVEQ